jgi:hypothetical protein
VIEVPEELGEIVPHAPGLQWESDQDTPLFWASFATLAVKICGCASWRVTVAGETDTEIAACGVGVFVAGGTGVEEEECAPELGTDAQPAAR